MEALWIELGNFKIFVAELKRKKLGRVFKTTSDFRVFETPMIHTPLVLLSAQHLAWVSTPGRFSAPVLPQFSDRHHGTFRPSVTLNRQRNQGQRSITKRENTANVLRCATKATSSVVHSLAHTYVSRYPDWCFPVRDPGREVVDWCSLVQAG